MIDGPTQSWNTSSILYISSVTQDHYLYLFHTLDIQIWIWILSQCGCGLKSSRYPYQDLDLIPKWVWPSTKIYKYANTRKKIDSTVIMVCEFWP